MKIVLYVFALYSSLFWTISESKAVTPQSEVLAKAFQDGIQIVIARYQYNFQLYRYLMDQEISDSEKMSHICEIGGFAPNTRLFSESSSSYKKSLLIYVKTYNRILQLVAPELINPDNGFQYLSEKSKSDLLSLRTKLDSMSTEVFNLVDLYLEKIKKLRPETSYPIQETIESNRLEIQKLSRLNALIYFTLEEERLSRRDYGIPQEILLAQIRSGYSEEPSLEEALRITEAALPPWAVTSEKTITVSRSPLTPYAPYSTGIFPKFIETFDGNPSEALVDLDLEFKSDLYQFFPKAAVLGTQPNTAGGVSQANDLNEAMIRYSSIYPLLLIRQLLDQNFSQPELETDAPEIKEKTTKKKKPRKKKQKSSAGVGLQEDEKANDIKQDGVEATAETSPLENFEEIDLELKNAVISEQPGQVDELPAQPLQSEKFEASPLIETHPTLELSALKNRFLHRRKREFLNRIFESGIHMKFRFEELENLVTWLGGRISQSGTSHCKIFVPSNWTGKSGLAHSFRPHKSGKGTEVPAVVVEQFRHAFRQAGITPQALEN